MNGKLTLSALVIVTANAIAIDFENPPYLGAPDGVLLTGQDGWYLPPLGGADWNVFTYTGNTMGVGDHPFPGGGGDQFAGGVSQGGKDFARVQKDFAWGGNWYYEVSYDVNHQYLGQLPTAQDLGGWSLQDSETARTLHDLHVWDDVGTAATWSIQFNVFDAAGAPLNGQSPGTAWTGLATNRWYRITHFLDFVNNELSGTYITDSLTNKTHTFDADGWYMRGGSAPGATPMPTAYSFSVGGAAGNAFALDNAHINVLPEPATIFAVCAGLALLVARQRRK